MTKRCSREGCARDAFARGMCKSHYNTWLEKMRRDGRAATRPPSIRAIISKGMPGTREDIADRLGVTMAPTTRTVKKMHDAGEIHICGWEPPKARGGQWRPIFAYGAGVDAELCAVWRDVHARMRKRARQVSHAIRERNRARKASGPAFAALLAPLGV